MFRRSRRRWWTLTSVRVRLAAAPALPRSGAPSLSALCWPQTALRYAWNWRWHEEMYLSGSDRGKTFDTDCCAGHTSSSDRLGCCLARSCRSRRIRPDTDAAGQYCFECSITSLTFSLEAAAVRGRGADSRSNQVHRQSTLLTSPLQGEMLTSQAH